MNTFPLELVTIDEAAKRLSLSKRTILREISAGRFPRPVKIGRSSRVPLADLARYIEKLQASRT
ncbi:MAG: helix-turn-helix domain-containing protein [Opitutaceae bacterium]|nr:helix-turn-helix domain-containing protein [Opitutaceae bacterium]